ncbi:GyrI-like domain-containing protein [Bacillus luteolus]|uniref:GyrI-like domain-containing protein n=1 Tax=Litchfieldia luteola TaxID=682179 RepID=A0ABR9QN72_9BACI|nr:GyrI-like domain-containing protein [Cytobacillus luteolus]MBE4909614.1 GyrI-like domain-containing protein [Cytobacillus luteolus]MBP1941015.1 hypothetical protein [Cytobacillus luteolus]
MRVNDFRKIHKSVYSLKQGMIEVIDIPELQFVVAHGEGERNVYRMHDGDTIWSISRVVNRLKDMTKLGMDYKFKLMPLEVIWTGEIGEWTAMMQVPNLITEGMFSEAIQELEFRKRSVRVPVYLKNNHQGRCVQALHVGSYNNVYETLEDVLNFCKENGLVVKNRSHREIYINQPFCNEPSKLQTIVRVEVED